MGVLDALRVLIHHECKRAVVGAKVAIPDHWLEPLLRSDNLGASLRKLTALAGQKSGAVFTLEATDGVAVLSFLPCDPEAKGLAIAAEALVAAVTGVVRSVCGPDWRPSEILLVRRPPVHPKPYRAFSGAPFYGAKSGPSCYAKRLAKVEHRGAAADGLLR